LSGAEISIDSKDGRSATILDFTSLLTFYILGRILLPLSTVGFYDGETEKEGKRKGGGRERERERKRERERERKKSVSSLPMGALRRQASTMFLWRGWYQRNQLPSNTHTSPGADLHMVHPT